MTPTEEADEVPVMVQIGQTQAGEPPRARLAETGERRRGRFLLWDEAAGEGHAADGDQQPVGKSDRTKERQQPGSHVRIRGLAFTSTPH